MCMPIEIRLLEQEHIDRLMEIETLSFPEGICEDASVYERRIQVWHQGNLGFFNGRTLLGFLCCELWEFQKSYDLARFSLSHDPNSYHRPSGSELYISSFALDPKYRHLLRGKTAFSLGMEFLGLSQSFSSAILLVSDEWEAAKRIYRDYGFIEIRRLRQFFGNTDAVVMRTVFDSSIIGIPKNT